MTLKEETGFSEKIMPHQKDPGQRAIQFEAIALWRGGYAVARRVGETACLTIAPIAVASAFLLHLRMAL